MAGKSDYKKPRHNLYELLPEVFQTGTSESIIENTFNRFLSKPEFDRVVGYAGEGNKLAKLNRQIIEDEPHRQAFQLQPLIYNKIGTVQKIYSFKDIMNKARQQGVDVDSFDTWGELKNFNWVPPIDIDKFLNFQEYYWVKPKRSTVPPEYITIRNPCNVETEKVSRVELIVDRYGDTFDIQSVLKTEEDEDGNFYAKILIQTDLTSLFEPDFTFFVKETNSAELNNAYHAVVYSEYNSATNLTTVYVESVVSQNYGSVGVVSLVEFLDTLRKNQSCVCDDSVGWGLTGWDDNNLSSEPPPTWLQVIVSSLSSETPPPIDGPENPNQLWYKPSEDRIYQYNGNTTEWDIVNSNVSFLIDNTDGTHTWDLTVGCGIDTNQWQEFNYWTHKSAVKNFTTAYQAAVPIIEYLPSLEINEYVDVEHKWKYRPTKGNAWSSIDKKPTRFELYDTGLKIVDMSWSRRQFVFGFNYGDLSAELLPGMQFEIKSQFAPMNEVYTIESAFHQAYVLQGEDAADVRYRTVVTVVEEVPSPEEDVMGEPTIIPISTTVPFAHPVKTSQGDNWVGFHQHWLYDGQGTISPTAQRPVNPYLEVAPYIDVSNPTYVTQSDLQVREYRSIDSSGLNTVEFDGFMIKYEPNTDNVRVYVENIRQYGNYDEGVDGNGNVDSITFKNGATFSNIRVEVGAADFDEIGYERISVRTEGSDAQWGFTGRPLHEYNLTRYRKFEQVKTRSNQYPKFDLYNADGAPLNESSEIFRFKEDASAPLHTAVNRRIVRDRLNRDYTFEQLLVDKDDGKIRLYKNYTLDTSDAWYDTTNDNVLSWRGNTWSERLFAEKFYLKTIVQPTSPSQSEYRQDGMIWYDSTSNVVRRYNGAESSWDIDTIATYNNIDPVLQSIWKKGLLDETYVPKYVDKNRDEIAKGSTSGYWELPDPMYYNVEHRNKKEVTYRQLTKHFDTIIGGQTKLPGFAGTPHELFHLMRDEEINYGTGGTIKNYNGMFDTFISATTNENQSVPGIIEFARDQYTSQLFNIESLFRDNVISVLTDHEREFSDINNDVADAIDTAFQQNEFFDRVYGDTTSYDQPSNTGVKNWVSTLPIFSLSTGCKPSTVVDPIQEIYELQHHDLHFAPVQLSPAEIARTVVKIVDKPDLRRIVNDKPLPYGVRKPTLPPASFTEFNTAYQSSEPLQGVFWLHKPESSTFTLYRFSPQYVDKGAPTTIESNDGDLWLNISKNQSGLFVRETIDDEPVWTRVTTGTIFDGDFDTAQYNPWQKIDLDDLLRQSLLNIETKLYERTVQAQEPTLLINYAEVESINPTVWNEKERERFNAYTLRTYGDCHIGFQSEYNPADPFTWNYVNSAIQPSALPKPALTQIRDDECALEFPDWQTEPLNEFVGMITWNGLAGGRLRDYEVITGGYWKDIYQKIYGTPYPHLQPWVLQGYCDKPDYWDERYADTTGTRRWTKEMWTDRILLGIIPAGDLTPGGVTGTGLKGQAPRYEFVSVNIDDELITAANGQAYEPDEILPPYTPTPIADASVNTRSIYNHIENIIKPHVEYKFGDAGRIEWEWRNSISYAYDRLITAYQVDPLRTLQKIFGARFNNTAGLLIDRETAQLYAHDRAVFHGELKDGNDIHRILGLNQWYVNFNRYTGLDASSSDFKQDWTNWYPRLGYQFDGFVDNETLQIFSNTINLTDKDLTITTKNTKGADDIWVDSLKVNVAKIPANDHNTLVDTDAEWEFVVDLFNPGCVSQSYYPSIDYDIQFESNEQVGVMYQYNIVNVNTYEKSFAVEGNRVKEFSKNANCQVLKTTNNDGTYTINDVVYSPVSNRTEVFVNESITDPKREGKILANYYDLPLETGDPVQLYSNTGVLPFPYNTITTYYIIKHNAKVFSLAATPQQAAAGEPLLFDDTQTNQIFRLQQLRSTYNAADKTWRRLNVDRTNVEMLTSGTHIVTLQKLMNLVEGYAEYLKDQGIEPNIDNTESDDNTGYGLNWTTEKIRFINLLHDVRLKHFISQQNNYSFEVDDEDNGLLKFTATKPKWGTGTIVRVSSDVALPTPLRKGAKYYILRALDTDFFYLSNSKGESIPLTNAGTGKLTIEKYTRIPPRTYAIEINPFRYALGYKHGLGVLSNVIDGPFKDYRIENTIFDQNSDKILSKNLLVQRNDKQSNITHKKKVLNKPDDALSSAVLSDQYLDKHITGAHLFTDHYEQVMLLNAYTAASELIYDQFVGLNTPKVELEFLRQSSRTRRPSVGGAVISGDKMMRNFEGQLQLQQQLFDTVDGVEGRGDVDIARQSLGYEGPFGYLDELNVNKKGQFWFWQGAIQKKGAHSSIKSYINSRRFVDAKLDDYWAYKISDFGDSREHDNDIELLLKAEDSKFTNLKLQFSPDSTDPTTVNPKFELITPSSTDRWFDQPDQQQKIGESDSFKINAKIKSQHVIDTSSFTDNTEDMLANKIYKDTSTDRYFYKTDTQCDNVLVTYIGTADTNADIVTTKIMPSTGTDIVTVKKINSRIYEFVRVNSLGVVITEDSDFTALTELTIAALGPAYEEHSPVDLVDKQTRTRVTTASMFNPADGQHYHNAVHEIDIQSAQDPAAYTASAFNDIIPEHFWNVEEVGTVWMDTSTFAYAPYYDEKVFPDVEKRMDKWGELAPWSIPRIYEWVESPVAPSQYNNFAVQSATSALPEDQRSSGSAKRSMYFRERRHTTFTVTPGTRASALIPFDKSVYGETQGGDPTGLIQNHTQSFTWRAGDSLTFSLGTEYLPGHDTLTVMVNGSVIAPANVIENTALTFTLTGLTLSDYDNVTANIVSPIYSVIITIDSGTPSTLNYDGSLITTFQDLVSALNDDLPDAVVTLDSDGIRIQSGTDGSTSSVQVTDNVIVDESAGLFLSLANVDVVWAGTEDVDGTDTTFTTPVTHEFNDEEVVILSTDDTLPVGMAPGARYVLRIIDTTTFRLETLLDVPVTLADVGVGTHTIAAATFTQQDGSVNWKKEQNVHQIFDVIRLNPEGIIAGDSGFELNLDSTKFNVFDLVNVFINEQSVAAVVPVLLVDSKLTITLLSDVRPQDTIRVTRLQHIITAKERQFNPNAFDDGTIHTQYKEFYDFSYVNSFNDDGTVSKKYYFWVYDKSTKNKNQQISPVNVVKELFNMPTPYFIASNLIIDESDDTQVRNAAAIDSAYYNQLIIRNHNKIVTDNNRYVLQLVANKSQRYDLVGRDEVKPVHEEWTMIRREQLFHPPKQLWDKMVEAIIGYKMDDSNIPVPSINRTLYDEANGTLTRFGIQDGQAFVESSLGLATVLNILQDSTIDYFPISIERFFQRNSFDTPENIRASLVEVYNTFASQRVNDIFFAVLEDAFASQPKYKDIFKTSWIALHGIRVLETPELYDD